MMTTRAFTTHKSKAIMAISIACAALVVVPDTTAEAGNGYWRWGERCVMRRINEVRRAHGLGRLGWDPQLGYVARVHAKTMARNRGVWHDYRAGDRVTRWYRLGQNTGRSVGCRSIVRSFMRSSSHRANILGAWRYVGAGVIDTGRYKWVQILFETNRDPGNIWRHPG